MSNLKNDSDYIKFLEDRIEELEITNKRRKQALEAETRISKRAENKLNKRVEELEVDLYNLEESALEAQMDFLEANGKKNTLWDENQRYKQALEHIEKNSNDKVAVFIAERSLKGIGPVVSVQSVEELESEKEQYKLWFHKQKDKTVELYQQNNSYKQALEFYADRQAYYYTNEHQSEVNSDYGDKARKALKEDESE